MEVRTRAHWLPKAGHQPDEFEDAFWPDTTHRLHVKGFRCAIADGATETSFSDLWARMLAYEWARGFLEPQRFSSSLSAVQAAWWKQVSRKPLPWYAEEKLRSGAFSSLLGLSLTGGRGARRWHALAVGDSCLFHIRGGDVIAAFPLADPDQFDNRPLLLSSNALSNGQLRSAIRRCAGSWRPGDSFYLMTDALACWFLRDVVGSSARCAPLERDRAVVGGGEDGQGTHKGCPYIGQTILENVAFREPEDGSFGRAISKLRQTGRLRNDDVTLLQVDVA